MRRTLWTLALAAIAAGTAIAQKPAQRNPIESPASQHPPRTVTPQAYPIEEIRAGEVRFVSQCGFCHGRDAAGGETGPDLTRSKLVAGDNRGDKIGPLVRAGRPDQGMPKFTMSDEDLNAIVAFIHDQKTKAESEAGGRRSVAPEDLATGSAAAGRRYFNGAGGCSACHSPTGDLAGIASRYEGLALMMQMLYPGDRTSPAPPDALAAHFDQLGKYTDDDMHDVYAYLVTLK